MGANVVADGVLFRVWAPAAKHVELEVVALPPGEGRGQGSLSPTVLPMERQSDGTWILLLAGARPGTRYMYRTNGGALPDPYSRFQPDGVHGPSEVVDPQRFGWSDHDWPGLDPEKLVIYECHVGTFTREGTFEAAIGKLPYLRDLGVTALELMPVAEFSGQRNWGYDGVDWFAPSHSYGGPTALRRLVDAAHQVGLGVLLDVVYNHFGPEGNYLHQYSAEYFTDRYQTPWGEAVNYDGPNSHWARKLAIDSACYWLREYHADGLRLDATFAIFDRSSNPLLRELCEAVRAEKSTAVLIAETYENDARYLRPLEESGYGYDAVWADDFHHALRRRLAGDHESYYQDYTGSVAEIARTLNHGFLYEGQTSPSTGRARGTPARDRPAWQFVFCIQNHDQIGNRPFGDRLNHAIDPALYRLASALLLLSPYTPLLFMGQEFAASSPFPYFTDHSPDLGRQVTEGRRGEFKSLAAFSDPVARQSIPDPQADKTFLDSKLRWGEAQGSPMLSLYQACLRLRREDPVLTKRDRRAMQANASNDDLLLVRWDSGIEQRLLVANFGTQTVVSTTPFTEVLLDTSDARFGGPGACAELEGGRLTVPAATAVLLG